jgi:dihydroflavonol-4-reductase
MVLITGASGFLGRHLVRYLSAKGVRLRALYHSHPPGHDIDHLPGVEWIRCDLLDVYAVQEAMAGITDIYHCAAIVTFDPRRRKEMLHFNPESTANIVNEALQQQVRKLVYVSSIAALGRNGEQTKEVTEEEEWGESRYNSAYGISKYLAEMEVWRGIGEGLNAVIINPGIIIGEGSGHDISSRLMKMVYREFPFYSKGVTSWVGAEDVVRIVTGLMGSDIEGERFIVSNANLTFREVLAKMATALNKRPARYYATSWMTSLAWRLSMLRSTITGESPLITRETVNNANSVCLYNNNKLLTMLTGFTYTPLERSIDAMARSFLYNNKK